MQAAKKYKTMQFIYGLILTLLATPALIWLAHHYGWLDHPSDRKHHVGAVPIVGGLAMAFAIAVTAAWHFAGTDHFWGLLSAVSIIVLIGFLDDQTSLPVGARFFAQGVATLIMALFADTQFATLGNLLGYGTVVLGMMALPFTIFSVLGITNALNLSDGMDGLAGGLALVTTVFLAAAAYISGKAFEFDALLILCGVLVGFLFFNMRFPWQRRAKVFMGDSGSLMLGFLIAWAIIRVTQGGGDTLPPAASLWLYAIPLWDTVSLMLRRMLKGKSPFHPGRDHLHHILLRLGYSDAQVVRFILLVAAACGLVGLWGWLWAVPDAVLFYAFLTVFALYFAGVHHAWKLMRLIMPLHRHP